MRLRLKLVWLGVGHNLWSMGRSYLWSQKCRRDGHCGLVVELFSTFAVEQKECDVIDRRSGLTLALENGDPDSI